MTFRVNLRIDGESDGAKGALTQTRAEMQKLEKEAVDVSLAAQRSATSIKKIGGATPVLQQSAGAIRLNQQQLMNMQFQMNDMATMLASGQSPFVLMMQQGMQIGQMFGPGATVSQALKATGAGLMSFVLNPINLTIAGFAVLAGAIPLVWEAISGPEAASAEDMLDQVDQQIRDIEQSFYDAGDAARTMLEKGMSRDELLAGVRLTQQELAVAYQEELDKLEQRVARINASVKDAFLAALAGDAFSEGEIEIAGLVSQLVEAEITAEQFRSTLGNIIVAENTTDDVRELAQELFKMSLEARKAQAAMGAMGAGGDALETEGGAGESPRERRERERAEREAERDARRAEREAERMAREAERAALERANNVQTLADLEAEIAALSLTGEAREFALEQLREEQEIRSAIAALGETATQSQIDQLNAQVPIRNALLEQQEREHDLLRENERAAQAYARSLASMINQLVRGADAGDVFLNMLMRLGSNALENSLSSLLGGGGGGGGGNLLSLLFSAKGNAFDNGRVIPFAFGGVVDQPMAFPLAGGVGVAGEAGPEGILPLKRGPDGRLGVSDFGGGRQLNIHLIGEEGAMFTPRVREISGDTAGVVVSQASPRIVGEAVRQSGANVMPTIGRYQREVAGGDYRT